MSSAAPPPSYAGESVREAVDRLYGHQPDAPVRVLHATVPVVSASSFERGLPTTHVMEALLDCIREQLHPAAASVADPSASPPTDAAITDHWLLSVPESLRHDEAAVVNYLGMLAAIDFCHWAEVPGANSSDTKPAGVGEEVTAFAGFYAAVVPPQSATPASGDVQSVEHFTEQQSPSATAPVLLRGSAAMMYLLRRAVEVHNVAWHDPHFLACFDGDVAAATDALRVCFLGCAQDGATPLWMPCTRERVELLLSLAAVLLQRRTSFYALLGACGGFMFASQGFAGVVGFVPSLVGLHPRYRDFASVPAGASDVAQSVPVLKLSQLTALAIEQALPALWRHRAARSDPANTAAASPAPPAAQTWLQEQAARVVLGAAQGCPAPASPPSRSVGVFADRALLSICCDYQIPKTLRAAGLLIYDDHLSSAVDRHVLLAPGSAEETSIRVATLVAADRLLAFLNAPLQRLLLLRDGAAASTAAPVCDVNHLDYALWYVGRYMVTSEARHHLCRTIMY